MTLADDVKSMYKHTKDVYDALTLIGAATPAEKNLQNLTTTFDTIELKPPYDPDNPQLSDLKAVLASENPASIYPIGTELPDTYDGQSNPLIVAQYLDSTNNSSYGGAEGVILVRKYIEPSSQAYGGNPNYSTSVIFNFLNSTYLNRCSDLTKNIISEIAIPYYTGSTMTSVSGKWHLMSATEVMAVGKSSTEGIGWDYWKQKTELIYPSDTTNAGRAMQNRSGNKLGWYLRSWYSSSFVCNVEDLGYLSTASMSSNYAVLPACFVAGNVAYTVEFDARGGVPVPEPQKVLESEYAVKPEPDPVKEGEDFIGWFLPGEVPDIVGEIPVMFRMQGGTPQETTQYVKTGGYATEPTTAPTKEGYEFLGWYEAGSVPDGWDGTNII